jgi:copper chaperone
MSSTLQLVVTGMTCGGCENAVKRVLLATPGVSDVRASHVENRVEVTFESETVEPAVLREKISSLGYAVAP